MAQARLRKVLMMLLCIVGIVWICSATGCASTEFGKHKTVWASEDHFWYSVYGYKNPTRYEIYESKARGWWGDSKEYTPEEVKKMKWKR